MLGVVDLVQRFNDGPSIQAYAAIIGAIIKEVANEVKDRMISKNALLSIAGNASKNGLVEEGVKLAITAMIGNYAQKNLKNSNWKKKAIGLALVYVAPIAIRYAIKKLEEYQKNKSISSLEQLI